MSLRERHGGTRARADVLRTRVLAGLFVFGVWLSIAPFALDMSFRATVNDSVVGVAVVALALIGLCRPTR